MWIDQYLSTGEEVAPGGDQLLGGRACYGIYETGDGKWMTLGALEPKFWRNFCLAIGRADLIDRQHDIAAQPFTRDEVQRVLRTRSRQEWLALLGDQTAVGPVNSIAELLVDPALQARPLVWTIPSSEGATVCQLAPRLAGGPIDPSPGSTVQQPQSTVTDQILADLGYSCEERQQLRRSGAVD
jgi:crotonobetainyl-CoA:carnitine CoA-transferase CaiB-like acyl-CoA transferase